MFSPLAKLLPTFFAGGLIGYCLSHYGWKEATRLSRRRKWGNGTVRGQSNIQCKADDVANKEILQGASIECAEVLLCKARTLKVSWS
jgi:hypothetical protein